MGKNEYTSKEMHEMVHNVLYHSEDLRLIRNILDVLEEKNYKGIFQDFEEEILSFNKNIKNKD